MAASESNCCGILRKQLFFETHYIHTEFQADQPPRSSQFQEILCFAHTVIAFSLFTHRLSYLRAFSPQVGSNNNYINHRLLYKGWDIGGAERRKVQDLPDLYQVLMNLSRPKTRKKGHRH